MVDNTPNPPIVIDVGPGFGSFSLQAATRGFHVASIEADPAYADLLQGAALLAPATGPRLRLARAGVRSVPGNTCEAYWRDWHHEMLEAWPSSRSCGRNIRADIGGPG